VLHHSEKESRFLRLGRAATGRVLIVAYTVRRRGDGESIRIISARRASRNERGNQPRWIVVDPAGLNALSMRRINVTVGLQSPAIARAPAAV
jgi:ribonuclease toxin BrnT of type II toxin-antitoxin system